MLAPFGQLIQRKIVTRKKFISTFIEEGAVRGEVFVSGDSKNSEKLFRNIEETAELDDAKALSKEKHSFIRNFFN